MERKSLKNTTSDQFAILLEEMKRCPELAKGAPAFGCNKQQWKDKWDKIRERLNSHGPPIRNTLDWKRVWSDLKVRTNRKLKENDEVQKSEIEPFCKTFLTAAEQDVVEILSLAKEMERKRTHENLKNEGALTETQFEDPLELSEIAEISASLDRYVDSLFARPPSPGGCPSDQTSVSSSASTAADSATPRSPRLKRRKEGDDCLKLFSRKGGSHGKKIHSTMDRIANSQQNICNTLDRIANSQQNIGNTLDRIANTLEMFLTDSRRGEASEAKIDLR